MSTLSVECYRLDSRNVSLVESKVVACYRELNCSVVTLSIDHQYTKILSSSRVRYRCTNVYSILVSLEVRSVAAVTIVDKILNQVRLTHLVVIPTCVNSRSCLVYSKINSYSVEAVILVVIPRVIQSWLSNSKICC